LVQSISKLYPSAFLKPTKRPIVFSEMQAKLIVHHHNPQDAANGNPMPIDES